MMCGNLYVVKFQFSTNKYAWNSKGTFILVFGWLDDKSSCYGIGFQFTNRVHGIQYICACMCDNFKTQNKIITCNER